MIFFQSYQCMFASLYKKNNKVIMSDAKKELSQFQNESIANQAKHHEVASKFQQINYSTIKIPRNGTSPYSYTWYKSDIDQRITTVCIANSKVKGYEIGMGSSGRVKFGADKFGGLYAIKVQIDLRITAHIYNHANMLSLRPLAGPDAVRSRLAECSLLLYSSKLYYFYDNTKPGVGLVVPSTPQNIKLYNQVAMRIAKKKANLLINPSPALLMLMLELLGIGVPNYCPDTLEEAEPVNTSNDPNVNEGTISEDVRLAYGPSRKSNYTYKNGYYVGSKEYNIQKYAGPSLEYLLKNNRLDFYQKISTTRRVFYQTYKLHTGKLSDTNQGYIHCDPAPRNFVMNPITRRIVIIDYGISVTTDTTKVLYGPITYIPIRSDQEQMSCNSYANRVQGLGTSFDVFCLKRVVVQPVMIKFGQDRRNTIFHKEDWHKIPEAVRAVFFIPDDIEAIDNALARIKENNETALSLALHFIALEFADAKNFDASYQHEYDKLKGLTVAEQENICECLDFIDLLKGFGRVVPDVNLVGLIQGSTPLKLKLLVDCCECMLGVFNIRNLSLYVSQLRSIANCSVDEYNAEVQDYLNTMFKELESIFERGPRAKPLFSVLNGIEAFSIKIMPLPKPPTPPKAHLDNRMRLFSSGATEMIGSGLKTASGSVSFSSEKDGLRLNSMPYGP
jgi:hypothetical protein